MSHDIICQRYELAIGTYRLSKTRSPGAFAAVLTRPDEGNQILTQSRWKYFESATNNELALHAAINGLLMCPHGVNVRITSCEKYITDGIQRWLSNWKCNGWRTVDRKPVKNRELWQDLDTQISFRNVHTEWAKIGSTDQLVEAQLLAQDVLSDFLVDPTDSFEDHSAAPFCTVTD